MFNISFHLPLPPIRSHLTNLLHQLPLLPHLFRPATAPPPLSIAIHASPLFHLPPELRTQIYSYVLSDSSLAPLFIEGTNVRAAHTGHSFSNGEGTHTALLRTCRAVHYETQPLLLEVHELHLLLRRPEIVEDKGVYPVVCSVQHLQRLLEGDLRRLSLTCEHGSSMPQQRTSVLLLRWVCLLLRRRHGRENPLQSLTLRCTDDPRGYCYPTCKEVMDEIARERFPEMGKPAGEVFAGFGAERRRCVCAETWCSALGREEAGMVGAEEVFERVVGDLRRVGEGGGWWGWVRRLGR
ncbi:hypothetical protein B0A55_06317 [Friedmanniomyces simplex]|uniref:F-box domain-containing protein n=1 Tax=Friedmanniomyces simplex TaxID=329884 RepID=A0A4U0XGE4_9PEZI|nr:hypothetical protein B0A55_06317 [Friedmanniomyces simplex]